MNNLAELLHVLRERFNVLKQHLKEGHACLWSIVFHFSVEDPDVMMVV
jgi:hypothetical protein